MLDLLGSALGAPIQILLTLGFLFLCVVIMSIPALLGRGVSSIWSGLLTALSPSRRAAWLIERREAKERKRRFHDELMLFTSETKELGREEAERRRQRRRGA